MKSRDRIIDAAITVFAKKGRYGAHMEEIAATAHINKAMIYYIFHSKDELYLEVLKHVYKDALFSTYVQEPGELKTREAFIDFLSKFISTRILFFSNNQNYSKLMIDAISNAGEEKYQLINYFKNYSPRSQYSGMRHVIEKGKSMNIIRNIDADQLIISIMGMTAIYFFSRSITEIQGMEIRDEKKFLEDRKDHITDILINSIIVRYPEETKDINTTRSKSKR